MKYYVQKQAPAGNWVDSIGTNSLEDAKKYVKGIACFTDTAVRLIERADIVIEETQK